MVSCWGSARGLESLATTWHILAPCSVQSLVLFTNQGFGWWAQMWSEGLEPQGRIAQSIHAAWVQSPRFFSYTTLKQLFTCFQNRVAFQVASQLSPHSLSWHSCERHTAIGDEVVSSLGNRTIVIVSWAVAPSLITISGLVGSVMSHALKFQHFGCGLYHQVIMLRLLTYWHHLTSIFGGSGSSSNNKQFVCENGMGSIWGVPIYPRDLLGELYRGAPWCSAAIGLWNIRIDRAPVLECMCSSNIRMDAGQKTISWLPRQQMSAMTGGKSAHAATDQEQRLSRTSMFTWLDLQLSNTINYHQFASHSFKETARRVKVYLDQSGLVLLRALVHQGMERRLDATVRCLSWSIMISLDTEPFFGTLPLATDLPFSVFCRGHSHTISSRITLAIFSFSTWKESLWHHGIMNTLVDFMGSPWITYFPTCGSHRTFASVRLKKAGFQGKIKKLPGNLDRRGSFPHHASTSSTSSTLFGYWDQHVVLFTVSLSILTINNPEDTLNTSWSCWKWALQDPSDINHRN